MKSNFCVLFRANTKLRLERKYNYLPLNASRGDKKRNDFTCSQNALSRDKYKKSVTSQVPFSGTISPETLAQRLSAC